jgi:hypothetical protein
VFYRATGDRVGFVQHTGGRWHWTDTYMAHSGHRATREDVLLESERWSIEMIWRDNQGLYNDELSVTNVSNTQASGNASSEKTETFR